MKEKNYVKSYRELCKSSILLSLLMVVLHLMAAWGLNYAWGSGAVGKMIACEIFLHLSYSRREPNSYALRREFFASFAKSHLARCVSCFDSL